MHFSECWWFSCLMWNSDATLSSPPFGALVVLNIPRFPPHSSIYAPSHNPPSPSLFGALVLQTPILIFEEEKKVPSYLLMSGANVCKWCQKQEVAASLQKLRKVTFSAAILGTNSNKIQDYRKLSATWFWMVQVLGKDYCVPSFQLLYLCRFPHFYSCPAPGWDVSVFDYPD